MYIVGLKYGNATSNLVLISTSTKHRMHINHSLCSLSINFIKNNREKDYMFDIIGIDLIVYVYGCEPDI